MGRNRPRLGAMLKLAALLAGLLLSLAAEAGAIRLEPGEPRVVEFEENPSTGYSWRIDDEASRGLDVVAIEDNGHMRGASRPGAPGLHRWTLRARRSGRATLKFDYRRPWEPAPIETRRVEIIVP